MAKGSSRKSSGISSAIQADKEAQTKTSVKPQLQSTEQALGRPKEKTSKRSGIEAGTHFKLNITVPMELYKALLVEAAQDLDRDMSDIVTDLLKKHYKK